MEPINRLNRLVETLRQQIADSARRAGSTAGQSTSATFGNAAQARSALPDLRLRIQDRLRAVDMSGPEGQHQAKRVFLESVLAWEFGDKLQLDQQYTSLLDKIQEAVETDPEFDRQFTALLADLSRP
ncbi:MAG: hypothetical protein HY308_18540 [Gammaproteobacteria bacterium]|nr:hypothetical protein [Gammaproteobacteria bacterium]